MFAFLESTMNCEEYETTYLSVGPWGGQNGVRWDDGVYNSVRQVVICHGAAVDSIQFEYDKKGKSVWSEKHGGTGGIRTNTVKLDFPDEFLVSVSGHYGSGVDYYGPVLVRSLMFESNKRKYGPFGIQQGTQFSFPLTGGKVVGFHGRRSWHLNSIGVYLEPLLQRNPSGNLSAQQHAAKIGKNDRRKDCSDSEGETNIQVVVNTNVAIAKPANKRQAVSYGPWGGNGGMLFDDGVYTGVREVHITRYGGILSMRVCYDLNGQAVWGNKNGGSGGIRLDKIAFDYPSEILTHISGYYGSTILRGPTVVKSLTFHTNKRKYGPFGDEQGIYFSSGSNSGIVVGLHGRKGWFIDSIGVHVVEKPLPAFNTTSDEVMIPGMVKEPTAAWALGPWGGNGGKPWDDGVFSGIKKIFLAKGEAMYCIQIEYDRNGQSAWSVRHGGGSEGSSHLIKLEYPYEILTNVCGYYGSFTGEDSNKVITSLTFYTNKGKYGPFGEEIGTFFTSSKSEGSKIVGFHGRSGCYLNAVGVHLQQWCGDGDSAQPAERVNTVKNIMNKLFN